MTSRRRPFTAVLAAATLAGTVSLAPAPGRAETTQIGVLTCEVSGGTGLIVTSRKDLVCTFQNAIGGIEVYDGFIRKYGLDIGSTTGGTIVWNVVESIRSNRAGALSGNYAGVSGEASVFEGLGANVLVGGSRRSIALQPVSISGQSGLNLAVGVTDLTLRLRPPEPLPRRRP